MPIRNKQRFGATVGAVTGALLGAGVALGIASGLVPAAWPIGGPGLTGSVALHAIVGAVLFSVVGVTGGDAMDGVREVVKQIAVWLGIVFLLPTSVWYGASAFHAPPDWKQFGKSSSRLEEKIRRAKGEADKERLQAEKDQLDSELDAQERAYYGHMFWVAYPVGLVAFIVGTIFPVQTTGAGLMFGGLSSLATGCYSYWDRMGDGLRFGSLVVALAVVFGLGTWRFRSRDAARLPLV